MQRLSFVTTAFVVVTLCALGCASAPRARSSARRARPARAAHIAAGTRFDIERTVEERVDGELRATRHERIYLVVGDRASDGSYAAQALLVAMQGANRIGRILYDLRLAPDLTLRGDPIEQCEDLPDELTPERVLRHVLGAVPRPPRGARGSYDAELASDLREAPLSATVRSEEHGEEIEVRAEAHFALDDDAIGRVIARGPARMRVIAHVGPTLIEGDVRTRIESHAQVRDPSQDHDRTRPGEIRIDDHIVTTRAQGEIPREESCAPAGEFDQRVVVRMIQTRSAAIRACYERELREDPTISGTVRMTMTIQPDGTVTDVAVVEVDVPAMAPVGICIVGVISRFAFDPGPVGASVTYVFPFVFEPQG